MTPAFWGGFASDVNEKLAIAGRSIPTNNCRAGLRALFALAGRTAVVRSGASIADVKVHGTTATASDDSRFRGAGQAIVANRAR